MPKQRRYRFLFASAMFGGNASLFESMREMLSERDDADFDSKWILMENHPREFIARVPLISSNWTLKGGLSMRSRILSVERGGPPFDAAYFNHLIPAIFLTRFRRRVPSIIAMDVTPPLMDQYGQWYSVPPTSEYNPLEKVKYRLTHRAYSDAKYLMPFSEWVAGSLRRDYHMSDEKIRVMPAGINVSKWVPNDRSASADRPLRILFIGSDFMRKGGDMVVRLAARDEFRACEFHVLSYNDVGPKSPNVVVHSNIRPNSDDLRRLYQESDIFLLPSRADLSPIAILEAMAMELPVISTNVGGIPELVTDGTTGFVVPPDDESTLCERLRALVNDAQLRVRFGKQARTVVQQHFNLATCMESILNHLRRTADDARSRQPGVLLAATQLFTHVLDFCFFDTLTRCFSLSRDLFV